ncbi:LacI family DNA-binding transcriptional regulator [Novosphingobium humi]|uniref:LacI family DNA-binding transcriptional regulator n=1 Tax=Novosphingobium humi TaxID=2282397 RepID=UPI0025AF1154|nr:LacI family DNA-binding transcriptional regulator [Novosphingobium humi]WJT00837.1 LacI family transcriptional regulator [Novosphingobium humi]
MSDTPTIHDIAKYAGVSLATVSRVLREPEKVAPARRSRVREAIAHFNYVPNAMAQQLRQPRFRTILVIIPDISNLFFAEALKNIENVAHQLGCRILIGETQRKQERLDHYVELLTSRVADGLILFGSLLPGVLRDSVEAGLPLPFPLVLAEGSVHAANCPRVKIDNVQSGEMAVRHLIASGRKRIGMISGPRPYTVSMERLEGYRRALDGAGLEQRGDWVVEGNFSMESGYEAMAQLLTCPERPDGIFCASDEMAIGAQAAIREKGLRMPDDIALIGFDDMRFAAYASPPLTTIRQPAAQMGEAAVRMMQAIFRGETIEQPTIILDHELVIRESA